MKPMGMTPFLQIVRPTDAQNKIWDAVEAAIIEGMTPAEFRREAGEAWEDRLREDAKDARKVLT